MNITLKEIQAIAEELKAERAEKKKAYAHIYAKGSELEGVDDSYTASWTRGMDALMNRITERINNKQKGATNE